MRRFDENELARRLRGPMTTTPPDLAARIKAEIPEHVEVPQALTRRPGTLPLVGRLPVRHRVLALAATVLVAVAAGLVARRVLFPAPGAPLEVSLVAPGPATEPEAGPTAAAPAAATPQVVATAAPAGGPPAREQAAPPARDELAKGRQEAAGDVAEPFRPPAPQVMADYAVAAAEPAAEARRAAPAAVVGGVLAPAAGEADEERIAARSGFVEVRSHPRFETLAGKGARAKASKTGEQAVADRFEARQAALVVPATGAEPLLAPAPTGAMLLLFVPPDAVVTFEPTAVARYRPLPGPGADVAGIVELVIQQTLEPASPVLTVEVQPGRGPQPAGGGATVLRRADAAASFRAAPRSLRLAYLEARLADAPAAGAEEAAALLAEAEAFVAEDPTDGVAQALRDRWRAVAGAAPPGP